MKRITSIILIANLMFLILWTTFGGSEIVKAANTEIKIRINGELQDFAQKPVEINGVALVPMRVIFKALDADLTWNEKEHSITVTKENKRIYLILGEKFADINGSRIELNMVPQLINGATMVPLRFISEALGAQVIWDETTKIIDINLFTSKKSEKVFYYYLTQDPSLLPTSSDHELINNIYEGLFRYDSNHEIQNAMADDYEISSDGLTWTFKIRQDANWSDGSPVTANDFMHLTRYRNIKDIQVIDDKSLKITLSIRDQNFKDRLTDPTYFPIKADLNQEDSNYGNELNGLVFNGPFKVTNWVHNRLLVLEKNKKYWDAENVKLNKVVLQIVDDSNVINLYDEGNIDVYLSIYKVDDFTKYNNEIYYHINPTVFYLAFNTNNPLLANKNIRKALSYAINRQEYLKGTNGRAISATGLVPPTMSVIDGKSFREENGDLIEYDLIKAKEYLRKGLEELNLKKLPKLKYVSLITDNYLEQFYRKIGVDITFEKINTEDIMSTYYSGDFDLISMAQVPYFDFSPSNLLDDFAVNNLFNTGRWSNQQYQNILREASKETDLKIYREKLLEAERILVEEEAAIAPLFFGIDYRLTKPYVKGYVRHLDGTSSWKWMDIDIDSKNQKATFDVSQVFYYMIRADSENIFLDPQRPKYQSNMNIINNIYEGLFRFGQDKEYHNAMAKDYEVSEDGLIWEITIRDTKWSDGTPVTADDFVYAINRAKEENDNTYNEFLVHNYIKEAYAENSKTLIIRLYNPTPYLKSLLSLSIFFPLKKEFVERVGESFGKDIDNILTNGPFKITKWKPIEGYYDKIVLEKNEKYWDADNVKLQKIYIELKDFMDDDLDYYNEGITDIVYYGPYDWLPNDKLNNTIKFENDPVSFYLILNTQNLVLNNKNIRKALSLSFDREQFLPLVDTKNVPATGLISPGIPGLDNKTFREINGDLIEYNIEKAKEYLNQGLKELGIDKIPPLKFVGSSKYEYEDIKDFYNKIGIDIIFEEIDEASQKGRLGEFDLLIFGWQADYFDPLSFLEVFTLDNKYNYGKWSNDKYEELINKAKSNIDNDLRINYMAQAEKILVEEEAAIVPIYFRNRAYLVQPFVKNYFEDPLSGYADWKWMYIDGSNVLNMK